MIGNRIITRDAQIQLVAVENGTTAGCTISGMYNHTTGPKDNPNTPINKKSPVRINPCPALSADVWSPLMKKPIATNKFAAPSNKVPYWTIVFRPNLNKRKPVTNVPSTCSKLTNVAISSLNSPVTAFEAISPPYTATALIPASCWRAARFTATMIGILLVFVYSDAA